MSRYLIGIDLGTTNSALAYIDLNSAGRGGRIEVHPFPVPQLAAPGEMKDREVDLRAAERLLASPSLYARLVHVEQPAIAARPSAPAARVTQ